MSTAARKITGWLLTDIDINQSFSPASAKAATHIEALQGQGSAMRTSVVRRGILDISEVVISSVVQRRYAFKSG